MLGVRARRGSSAQTNLSLIQNLTNLGLTSNLQICLDAGDANSYAGGTKWLDTSGNGHDFYRGTSAGGDGAEPAFNGLSGGLSAAEYFSSDGGDYFTYDAAAETWMRSLYMNNSTFSSAVWVYVPAGTSETNFAFFKVAQTDQYPSAMVGVSMFDSNHFFGVFNNSTGIYDQGTIAEGGAVPRNQWAFVATSYDESGSNGNQKYQIGEDAYTDTDSPLFSGSPSNTTSNISAHIGLDYVDTAMPSGARFGQIGIWNTYLTPTQLNNIYNATKSRYGL